MAPPVVDGNRGSITVYDVVQYPRHDKTLPATLIIHRAQCVPAPGEAGGFTVVEEGFWDEAADGTLDAYKRHEGTVSICTPTSDIRQLLDNAQVTHYLEKQSATSFVDRFRAVKAEAFSEFRNLADTIAATAKHPRCTGFDQSAQLYLETAAHGLSIYVQTGKTPVLTAVKITQKSDDENSTLLFAELVPQVRPHTPQPKNAMDYQHFLQIYQQTCMGNVKSAPSAIPPSIHYRDQ